MAHSDLSRSSYSQFYIFQGLKKEEKIERSKVEVRGEKEKRKINKYTCLGTLLKFLIHYLKRILKFPLLQFPSALEASGICEFVFLNKKFKLKQLSIIHVNSILGLHKLYPNLILTYSINQHLYWNCYWEPQKTISPNPGGEHTEIDKEQRGLNPALSRF